MSTVPLSPAPQGMPVANDLAVRLDDRPVGGVGLGQLVAIPAEGRLVGEQRVRVVAVGGCTQRVYCDQPLGVIWPQGGTEPYEVHGVPSSSVSTGAVCIWSRSS